MHRHVFLSTLIAILAVGCGSLVHGPEQRIDVATNPPGAGVFVSEMPVGTTPCSISLKRSERSPKVVLRKDGYGEYTVVLMQITCPWSVFGNLLIGGLPGWAFDAATGSMGQLEPREIRVQLIPVQDAQHSQASVNEEITNGSH